jgi:hypothetical protein
MNGAELTFGVLRIRPGGADQGLAILIRGFFDSVPGGVAS